MQAQTAAVADVDAVYKGEVDRVVALRLRVVDEIETATKIIGRLQEYPRRLLRIEGQWAEQAPPSAGAAATQARWHRT